jgi:hypothetical protein
LLVIHGGATHSGSGASPGASSGPPPALASTVNVDPVTVTIKIEADGTHLLKQAGDTLKEVGHEAVQDAAEVRGIVHDVHHSESAGAFDHFVATAINAATNYLFGPSSSGGSAGTGH